MLTCGIASFLRSSLKAVHPSINKLTERDLLRRKLTIMSKDSSSSSGDNPVPNKRMMSQCDKQLKIGTHDGVFHCDEVLACSMLKCLPEYENAMILRSRDPKLLDSCDIVVDVGGVYDPAKHRYDHHQRSFKETMQSLNSEYPWQIKLSSAGLVYFHFGKQIIAQILNEQCDSDLVENIYPKMYENFVQEIDGIDNGVDICDGEPRYRIHTNLSSRVRIMNAPWNDDTISNETRFYQASALVFQEFKNCLLNYSQVWWPAKELITKAVAERFHVHNSGRIIDLKVGGCPWKEHLYGIEERRKLSPRIDFVIYTDQNGAWRVQAVNVNCSSFQSRIPLKEEWRGLRDEELSKLSNIPGCIFVHANGFIGGNKTREGALQMALKTMGI